MGLLVVDTARTLPRATTPSIIFVLEQCVWLLAGVLVFRGMPMQCLKYNSLGWICFRVYEFSIFRESGYILDVLFLSWILRLSTLPPTSPPSPLGDTLLPRDSTEFPECMSLYSKLTFAWITPLMRLGASRPLREDDVFRVPSSEESERLSSALRASFDSSDRQSLFGSIRSIWWRQVMISGLWKTFNDGSQFTGPVFMSMIMKGLSDESKSWSDLIILSVSMYLCQIIGAIGEGQYFQTGMRVGMELRSALIGTIFQKSLRIKDNTGGKVTNMISSDTEQLQNFCEVMHVLWSAPLRIIVSMIMLYYLLGVAALAGVSVLIAMIPFQRTMVRAMSARVKLGQTFTDERLRIVTEVLDAIQLVKCYTWEESFREKLEFARNNELTQVRSYSILRAINAFLISAIPILVAVFSFSAYSLIPSNPPLSAVQAFTALSLFSVIRFPLMQLPNVINMIGACQVSLGRIYEYLVAEERQDEEGVTGVPGSIELSKCTFSWPNFSLNSISLSIAPGELIVLVGATASGKSSLLQGILGHMPLMSGKRAVGSREIAYCSQSAWIFNGTVRENIVFGDPLVDESRYQMALRSVCFDADLHQLASGDSTEIGEKGVNLSGGQKHRLALARAVYASTNICLLDDPLSALDPSVAQQVFRGAIVEGMRGRTRVLVTNRLEAVMEEKNARFIVLGVDGRVVADGPLKSVRGVAEFDQLVSKMMTGDSRSETPAVENTSVAQNILPIEPSKKFAKKLISTEDRQTGAVNPMIAKYYTDALGWFPVIVLSYILTETARVSASVWLSEWTRGSTDIASTWQYYLGVYILLSCAQLGFSLFSQLAGAVRGNIAARKLHMRMFDSIVRSPMGFFTATPVGRIQNRFAKDVTEMDRNLMPIFAMTLSVFCGLMGTLVVLAGSAMYTVIAFIPLAFAFYRSQAFYRASSREIKRMDSISRSPIYAHFKQVQDGIGTVLAYAKGAEVTLTNSSLIDNHIRFNLAQMSCNRWLGIRLEFYGGAIVLLTGIVVVISRDWISAGLAGLALSTALQVTGGLGGIVRLSAMLENSLNSIERISVYSNLDSEPQIEGVVPPLSWPSRGAVTYTNVVAFYRPGIDVTPVLDRVSFTISGGEKIGVIGRTGAGKTSLVMTLFRILETSKGTITIDGIDIAQIGLKRLRKALGIIPQDPLVFQGTLRSNIDPFGSYTDDQVRSALRAAHLLGMDDLDVCITHGGGNLSAGQRQQVCLARVLLRQPKILVMDEATSSLDAVTDNLVADTIRTHFSNATVITIAHRLHTIVDSDKLIVLDKGRVVQLGSPRELVGDANGIFADMIAQTGKATSKYLKHRIAQRASHSSI
jgi:ATP-binding cassette, subfamily C (CFTR/MRP), member 1